MTSSVPDPGGPASIRILQAAERLFAENGIEAVSLRQIAAAAGQRNTSAVAYHYGSKPALVTAVYAWRMAAVNARRLEHLAAAPRNIDADDTEHLVRALVEPLAEVLAEAERRDEPSWYLRFMAESMLRYPEFDPLTLTTQRPETESIREVITRLAKTPSAQRLPREVFTERLRLVAILVVTALADRERRLQNPAHPEPLPAIGVEVLVNAGTAVLSAPWPPDLPASS